MLDKVHSKGSSRQTTNIDHSLKQAEERELSRETMMVMDCQTALRMEAPRAVAKVAKKDTRRET